VSVRLAITGLGVVGAAGVGPQPLADALRAGRALGRPIESWPRLRARRSTEAALVGTLPAHDSLPPLAARRMSPPSRFAVVAASDALAEAGLAASATGAPDPDRGVVLATAFGPSSFTERLLEQMLDDPQAASPSLFPECVASAPAAQVGIHTRSAGAALTLAAGEAGPIAAVAQACDLVRAGRSRRVLAGAVDEMTPLLHAVLDRFGALARGAPRPLARERDGYLAAEGAAIVLIEPREDAARRGAPVRAEIAAWGTAHDPTARPARWGERSDLLGRALARSLARADVAPSSIDRIVCGASGAVAGDRVEAGMLRAAWGRAPLPAVLAPKGVTGEHGGGLLAAASLTTGALDVGPVGAGPADSALDVAIWAGGRLDRPRRVLVTSTASGGGAAWLVLEAP
jgi:3-oxoacyl-(acyl-carrier-protein) synthase